MLPPFPSPQPTSHFEPESSQCHEFQKVRASILTSSKPASPKLNTPGEDDVVDIASGITGMEASALPKRIVPGDDKVEDIASGITGLAASSTDFPLPLLRSNAAHIAARRLASAVSSRIAQHALSSSPLVSAPGSPSLLSHDSVSPSLLCSVVSPDVSQGSGAVTLPGEDEFEDVASAVSARIAQSSSPAVVSAPVSPSLLPSVSPPLLTSDVSQGIAGAS